MNTQVQIDRKNTIQHRDEIKMGMEIWEVGQGGASTIRKPSFEGNVIGFGSSNYTFIEGLNKATGFMLKLDDDDMDTFRNNFITCIRKHKGNTEPVSKAELASMNIPEGGLLPNVDYPLGGNRMIDSISLNDRNISGGGYNNWYICESEAKAMLVYEEMLSKWTKEHETERLEFINRNAWMY